MKVKSIKELVEFTLNAKGNAYAEFTFGKLTAKQSKFLLEFTGCNLIGSARIVDTNGIRHTLKKHGSIAIEAKHGQIAVTADDFTKIPLILKEPDSISYTGQNRLKQDVFLYQKKIGMIYYIAEAVRFSKTGEKLIFQTMYKRKQKPLIKV